MRTTLIRALCLLAACDQAPTEPVGEPNISAAMMPTVHRVRPTILGVDCVEPSCQELLLDLQPIDPVQSRWTVDGVVTEGVSKLVIPAPAVGTFTEVEVIANGIHSSAIINNVGEVGDDAGIIIIGSQGDSCFRYYIRSVGGCVTQPYGDIFDMDINGVPLNDPVTFDTAPNIDLVLDGHSSFARWTPSVGTMVSDGRPQPVFFLPNFKYGLEYWFSLNAGETADIYVRHGYGAQATLVQSAICSADGYGSVAASDA